MKSTENRITATVHSKRLQRALLGVWAFVVAYGTLYPFSGWRVPANFHRLVTFAALDHVSATDVLANVLLYVPLGLVATTGRRLRGLGTAVFLALLLSLCLETFQAFLPSRVASWLDVAANVFGAAIGTQLLASAAAFMPPARMASGRNLAWLALNERVSHLAVAALAAWACAQLSPFVPSLDVTDLKSGLKPLWHVLRGTQSVDPWGVASYAAATAALTIAVRRLVHPPKWHVIAPVFLLGLLPLKVLVAGRQLSIEGLAGTCSGVALGLMLLAARRQRAWVVAALLAPTYVLIQELRPGNHGALTHAFNWVPLHAQLTQPLNGLASLADAVWPPLIVACLLCVRLGPRVTWLLLPAVPTLLFALEWAQVGMPGRYPDVTTVLAGTGAWIFAVWYANKKPIRKLARTNLG